MNLWEFQEIPGDFWEYPGKKRGKQNHQEPLCWLLHRYGESQTFEDNAHMINILMFFFQLARETDFFFRVKAGKANW